MPRTRLPSGLFVHRDKKGRVHYHYDFVHKSRRYRGWLGGIAREEAERMVAERRSLVVRSSEGLPPPQPIALDKTFAEVAEEYIASRIAKKRRERTIETLRFRLSVAVRFLGERPVAFLTPAELDAMLGDLLSPESGAKPWTARSVKGLLGEVSAVCRFASRRGYAARNPAEAVESPNIEPRPTRMFRYLHPRDDARLLGAFLKEWQRNAVAVSLYLGVRESAVTSIRRVDVNFDDGAIRLAGVFAKGAPGRGREDQWIPIPRHLLPFLRDQYRRSFEAGSPWLFYSPYEPHEHVHHNALYKAFKNGAARAGFGTEPRFHDLRSISETRFVASGSEGLYRQAKGDARLIAGHESEAAAALYIMPSVEYLRPVVARYDDWLDAKEKEPLAKKTREAWETLVG